MANRDSDREPRRRDTANDWDWDYYYEYHSTPYSPYLRNDYHGRDYHGPYYRNRDYDRDFDFVYGSSYPYGYGAPGYGRYSGYGPSGYTRPDDRIRDDINDRLTWDPRIDATDVNVDVNDGIVSLTGSVDSRSDKRVVEDIADGVSGVWDVNNQLRVRNRGYYRGQRGGANSSQIHRGMQAVDSDGKRIGDVKEVRSDDFLVDRPAARDVYVPFSACRVSDGQIRLNVRAQEVDSQGWLTSQSAAS